MKSWLHPKLRVASLVVIANVVALALAAPALDRASWFWFAPIALSINLALLTYGVILDFDRLRGEALRGQDPWGVLKMINDASAAAGIRAPEVFAVERASAQALSYSRFGRRARVVLTTGALNLLNDDERAAVVTHQVLAIRQGLAVVNYWSGAIADLVHRVGRGAERAVAFVIGWTPPIANWLVRPVTYALNFILLSPADFTRLDRATAQALPDGTALARALWKMDAYAQTRPWPEPWTFANMCLVSPIPAGHVWQGLRVQPPIAARIEVLAGRFPI